MKSLQHIKLCISWLNQSLWTVKLPNVTRDRLLIVRAILWRSVKTLFFSSLSLRDTKQQFLHCIFLWLRLLLTISIFLINVSTMCLYNVSTMAKIVLEKDAKELKLVKVLTSRYWQSCWQLSKVFQQSKTQLRWSMTVDQLLF